MDTSSQTQPRRRYRRYRVIGLLPALVIVVGGLYLGAASGNWIPLVAGLLFLIVCVSMIAYDRRGRRGTRDRETPADSTGR
jgi:hypothetical protein